MIAKVLLRAAAILMFVHLIGHSIGHSGWKNDSSPGKAEVIRAMTISKFPFMGVRRSMGDYFEGYGYIASVTLLLIASILWIISRHMSSATRPIRQIVLALGLALIGIGVLEIIYFFPFAASISLIAGILALTAGSRFMTIA